MDSKICRESLMVRREESSIYERNASIPIPLAIPHCVPPIHVQRDEIGYKGIEFA